VTKSLIKNYWVKFKKKKALVERKYYRKDEKFFYFEIQRDDNEIFIDVLPYASDNDPAEGVLLPLNSSFNGDGYTVGKGKLIFPENLSEAEVKLIKSEYKKQKSEYYLNVKGWAADNNLSYVVYGKFEVKEVPVHKLTLVTSQTELCVMKISEDQFSNYLKNGVPENEYEELDYSTNYSSPVFNTDTGIALDLDGHDVLNFYDLFKLKYNKAVEIYEESHPQIKTQKISDLEFAAVSERFIKRSFYTLTIYEEFDFEKLEIEISKYDNFGSESKTLGFNLSYSGVTSDPHFEFYSHEGTDYIDDALISSNGVRYDLSVVESEEDSEEDLDD
jgi:hypothetical protein